MCDGDGAGDAGLCYFFINPKTDRRFVRPEPSVAKVPTEEERDEAAPTKAYRP